MTIKQTEEQVLQEELLLEFRKLTTFEKRQWLAGLKASNNVLNEMKGECNNVEGNRKGNN